MIPTPVGNRATVWAVAKQLNKGGVIMSITLEEAKNLAIGQTIYCNQYRNADGSPQRWRVNGKVKTWKRTPSRVQVPLKHGLYAYGYLTESNLDFFEIEIEEKAALKRMRRYQDFSSRKELYEFLTKQTAVEIKNFAMFNDLMFVCYQTNDIELLIDDIMEDEDLQEYFAGN